MRRHLQFGLIGLVSLCPTLAADPIVDSTASFSGPFAGAQAQSEMAQSFEMSVSGFLHGIEAFVPSNSGPSCEFTWYLRNAATLNPQSPDMASLPILASGTGMSDTPASIYDAVPSVLLAGANVPVTAGDLLVLHIVRDCSIVWVAGIGTLPGDRYEFDGASWTLGAVANFELGRIIYASEAATSVEDLDWSLLKARYR